MSSFVPMHVLRRSAVVVTIIAAMTTAVFAQEFAPPAQTVVLTVSGKIATVNVGDTAQFDMAALRKFPVTEFETTTIWTEGPQTFRGVSLKVILDYLKASGKMLSVSAINDYSVEVPVSDAVENGPIIAYEANGKPMHRRDKGPLWLVYPYDVNPAYKAETIYTRSIWQMDRIEVQ